MATIDLQNWHGDPNAVPMATQPSLVDVLKSLLNIGQGQTNSAQAISNNMGQATKDQLSKAGQGGYDPNAQLDNTPYQEGVIKALKAAGEAHGTEYLQAGGDPNKIMDHPMMQPTMSLPNGGVADSSGKQIDPSQLLTTILAAHLATQNPNNTQQNDAQAQPLSIPQAAAQAQVNQLTPQQQDALNIASTPKGFMGRFSQNFDNIIGLNQQRLANISQAQKISGQQPLQQSEYQQAALDVNKAVKLAQQVPLTQEQQGLLTAGSNSAKLQIYNDSATRINSQIDNLTKQFEAEQKTISPTQAALAAVQGKNFLTPRMKMIQGQL